MKEIETAIKSIIAHIGDDPLRKELLETPRRLAESYDALFSGYKQDASAVFKNAMENEQNTENLIIIKDIKFTSFCEHHMLPFFGTVNIGYIPSGKIGGIGSFRKLVNILSKRLQIQERLTDEIAKQIKKQLSPLGIAVHVVAKHFCTNISENNADMLSLSSSHYSGAFNERPQLRDQFLTDIKLKA